MSDKCLLFSTLQNTSFLCLIFTPNLWSWYYYYYSNINIKHVVLKCLKIHITCSRYNVSIGRPYVKVLVKNPVYKLNKNKKTHFTISCFNIAHQIYHQILNVLNDQKEFIIFYLIPHFILKNFKHKKVESIIQHVLILFT